MSGTLRLLFEHACFGGVPRLHERRHAGHDPGCYVVARFTADHLRRPEERLQRG